MGSLYMAPWTVRQMLASCGFAKRANYAQAYGVIANATPQPVGVHFGFPPAKVAP
jgi:hypothetical protein